MLFPTYVRKRVNFVVTLAAPNKSIINLVFPRSLGLFSLFTYGVSHLTHKIRQIFKLTNTIHFLSYVLSHGCKHSLLVFSTIYIYIYKDLPRKILLHTKPLINIRWSNGQLAYLSNHSGLVLFGRFCPTYRSTKSVR